MNIVIVAGGGGHFASALAVIEALQKDATVTVIGRKFALEGDQALSFEYRVAKELGILFVALETGRLQRKLTKHTLASLAKTPSGLWQAHALLRKIKPDVLVSFGGYVSLPVVLAAYLQRIPVVLHEQTLEAGLANRLSSPFAKKICVSWKTSESFFPKRKTVLTGIPLRKEIMHPVSHPSFPPPKQNGKMIFVTGGSSGAHAINQFIEKSLDAFLDTFTVVHQTGDAREFSDFERLNMYREKLSKEKKDRYIIKKFLNPSDVGWFLKHSDLVICRAGMNTAVELLHFGKPCVLIPLPYGQKNEQKMNASLLYTTGLSEVVDQYTTTPQAFTQKVLEMMPSLDEYKRNANEAKKLLIPNATENIVEVITKSVTKKQSS